MEAMVLLAEELHQKNNSDNNYAMDFA
jgi:hypothetical protein